MKLVALILAASNAMAQTVPSVSQERPPLFFREDWKETPPALPVTQQHVANPKLELMLYGPGKDGVKKSHHAAPADDPYYIWTGTCTANCAVGLRDRDSYVDLTGLAKIRWRTKQAGFRQLHVIVKLVGGMWLVSDLSTGSTSDWHEAEFNLADVRWRRLDIDHVIEGAWVDKPDLSKVDEIGFTDLTIGGSSAACSRLDWIEVYGRPVQRPAHGRR